MVKIHGLKKLQRELNEAQRALEGIDGEMGSVSFDPQDPSSIEAAIASALGMVDSRLDQYCGNELVNQLAEGMKDNIRQQILDKAAEARSGSNDES